MDGERSGLFWKYVEIWKAIKPKYWVLENVNSMPKDAKRIISETLGVDPIMINAALVSAQSRKRLFWTNIPSVKEPEISHLSYLTIEDILEEPGYPLKLHGESNKSYCLDDNYWKSETLEHHISHHLRQLVLKPIRDGEIGKGCQGQRIYSVKGKGITLSANGGGQGAKTGLYRIPLKGNVPDGEYTIRKLTPVECERLQSLPDGYTEGISNTQRYKCLGNAFNVEVVRHILSFMDIH